MKPERTFLLAAAFALLAAGPSRAQESAGPETSLNAALDQARAAVAASPAKPITSCPDARELETPFELTVAFADGRKPLELSFEYAACQQFERNDYLPPYTERSYRGAAGYGLTIVTNEDEPRSDVLVSQGSAWLVQFGKIENTALVSGNPVAAGEIGKGKAVLRDSAKPLYPQLKTCEAADWTKAAAASPRRDASGSPETGFGPGPSLVLLTNSAAYYYHEDCDICAEVTKCELATGRLSSVIAAHEVSCADIKSYAVDAVYDACAGGR